MPTAPKREVELPGEEGPELGEVTSWGYITQQIFNQALEPLSFCASLRSINRGMVFRKRDMGFKLQQCREF